MLTLLSHGRYPRSQPHGICRLLRATKRTGCGCEQSNEDQSQDRKSSSWFLHEPRCHLLRSASSSTGWSNCWPHSRSRSGSERQREPHSASRRRNFRLLQGHQRCWRWSGYIGGRRHCWSPCGNLPRLFPDLIQQPRTSHHARRSTWSPG